MSTRPVIFISAVSCELKTARQAVANCLTSLGYTPEWQDIFTTDSGPLLEMLRRKVDRAAAVVQIVGRNYGAEPAAPPPGFPRCSYTQYEALYAVRRKKPVHYITLGPDFPSDSRDPEPDELRELQRAYMEAICASGHLRHPAGNATELDNKVLRLRDDLARLRRRTLQWAAVLTVAVLAIAGGVAWMIFRTPPADPAIAGISQKLDAAAARDAALLQALRRLPAVMADVPAGKDGSKPADRTAAAFATIEQELQLPAGTIQSERQDFTSRLLQVSEAGSLDRALALFADSRLPESEAAALAAHTEALRRQPPDITTAIAALEAAGTAAREQVHFPDALAHWQKAADLTNKERDPLEWARVQHWLARGKLDMLQNSEAQRLWNDVLVTRRALLGPDARDTLSSRYWCVVALIDSKKYTVAEEECRNVLAAQERVLGPHHPDTLKTRNGLAVCLVLQNKDAESEKENQTILTIRERVLGPEHPDTLKSRLNLANGPYLRQQYAEAEAANRALLPVLERVLGPEHYDTLACRNNRALSLYYLTRYAEAAAEHKLVLAVRERFPGPEHPITIGSRTNLAVALYGQGKHAEAEALHRAVLTSKQRILDPDDPDIFGTHFNLALCLEAQQKYGAAIVEARTAYRGCLRVLNDSHPLTINVKILMDRLAAPR